MADRIAAGVPLSFIHKDVRLSGAAIECRINARSAGTVKRIHVPGGPFVRFATYLEYGSEVTPYYDSLEGKLMVVTRSRYVDLGKVRA